MIKHPSQAKRPVQPQSTLTVNKSADATAEVETPQEALDRRLHPHTHERRKAARARMAKLGLMPSK